MAAAALLLGLVNCKSWILLKGDQRFCIRPSLKSSCGCLSGPPLAIPIACFFLELTKEMDFLAT